LIERIPKMKFLKTFSIHFLLLMLLLSLLQETFAEATTFITRASLLCWPNLLTLIRSGFSLMQDKDDLFEVQFQVA